MLVWNSAVSPTDIPVVFMPIPLFASPLAAAESATAHTDANTESGLASGREHDR